MSSALFSTIPTLVTANAIPMPEDIIALNNALTVRFLTLEGAKNMVVATSNAVGHQNMINACFPMFSTRSSFGYWFC